MCSAVQSSSAEHRFRRAHIPRKPEISSLIAYKNYVVYRREAQLSSLTSRCLDSVTSVPIQNCGNGISIPFKGDEGARVINSDLHVINKARFKTCSQ